MTADRDRRGRQEGSPGGGGRPGGGPRPGASRAVKRAIRRGPAYEKPRLVLGKVNFYLMGLGVLSVVLGFSLLSTNDISLAAFLLVLGYCALIPAGLLVEHVPGAKGPSGNKSSSGGE